MMMNTFKTLTVAAGVALFGSMASAATVAEISSEGEFALLDFGAFDGIAVGGVFSASFDPTFDTAATNDFLFELDFAATGIAPIDEELLVPGITGDDIIGFALFILAEIDGAFPGTIDAIIGEVLDGDLAQTEIAPDLWFGFDYAGIAFGPASISGSFEALLSEGDATGLVGDPFFVGEYIGSASVSVVPLPATLPLLGFAATGLFALGRRRKA
jgi:hypothetical protein